MAWTDRTDRTPLIAGGAPAASAMRLGPLRESGVLELSELEKGLDLGGTTGWHPVVGVFFSDDFDFNWFCFGTVSCNFRC